MFEGLTPIIFLPFGLKEKIVEILRTSLFLFIPSLLKKIQGLKRNIKSACVHPFKETWGLMILIFRLGKMVLKFLKKLLGFEINVMNVIEIFCNVIRNEKDYAFVKIMSLCHNILIITIANWHKMVSYVLVLSITCVIQIDDWSSLIYISLTRKLPINKLLKSTIQMLSSQDRCIILFISHFYSRKF